MPEPEKKTRKTRLLFYPFTMFPLSRFIKYNFRLSISTSAMFWQEHYEVLVLSGMKINDYQICLYIDANDFSKMYNPKNMVQFQELCVNRNKMQQMLCAHKIRTNGSHLTVVYSNNCWSLGVHYLEHIVFKHFVEVSWTQCWSDYSLLITGH